MNTLTACYGTNQNTNAAFIAILRENLPSDLSVAQGKSLARRIVTTHKFAPSLADILEEWRQMRHEMNRRVYEAPKFTGHMSREAAQLLREAKDRIRDGKTADYSPVTPKVMRFVQQFFPEISESTVQRNRLEIMNCMRDREKETAANSQFRTCMAMDNNGMITLFMRKVI
jgi:hypothetical protein